MDPYWLGILGAAATVLFVFEMLRRGILRERFAALWLIVSVILLAVALFPRLLGMAADVFGVAVAANFLFFVSVIFLLLVAVQLSFEVSRLEGRSRRLAEDLALLRCELGVLRSRIDAAGVPPDPVDGFGRASGTAVTAIDLVEDGAQPSVLEP